MSIRGDERGRDKPIRRTNDSKLLPNTTVSSACNVVIVRSRDGYRVLEDSAAKRGPQTQHDDGRALDDLIHDHGTSGHHGFRPGRRRLVGGWSRDRETTSSRQHGRTVIGRGDGTGQPNVVAAVLAGQRLHQENAHAHAHAAWRRHLCVEQERPGTSQKDEVHVSGSQRGRPVLLVERTCLVDNPTGCRCEMRIWNLE